MAPIQTKDKELDLVNFEDLQHLSELWKKDGVSKSELRNSSHILRRLLIYGDIFKSATPRKMKLRFHAPDNKPINKAIDKGLVDFFQSAGTSIYGIWMRGFMGQFESPKLNEILSEFDPERVVEVRDESFLNQEVFYFQGQRITRSQVISYVANKLGGPHFDRNREDEFAILDRVRQAYTISIKDGIPQIIWNLPTTLGVTEELAFSLEGMDPVYIEFASACRYLTDSPSVLTLVEAIRIDLNLISPSAG